MPLPQERWEQALEAEQEQSAETELKPAWGSGKQSRERSLVGGWQLSGPQSSLLLWASKQCSARETPGDGTHRALLGVPSPGRKTQRGDLAPAHLSVQGEGRSATLQLPLTLGSPTHLPPGTLHTHHISAVGHAGSWDRVAPPELSGLAVIHRRCPWHPGVHGTWDSKTGLVGLAECHRGPGGAGAASPPHLGA